MDPYLHGGGIHSHPNGGKLDMHLDYSIHPISKKERRLNLILYLNKEWDKSYGGELQMWNDDMSECIQKVFPKFNRALLFQTSDLSYHGIPDKINCPNHLARNSIAIYYVSEPRENVILRKKAQFVKRPFEENSEGMEKLRKIRVDRLITNKDIQDAGFEIEEWPIIS
jgi:hypothetical protein